MTLEEIRALIAEGKTPCEEIIDKLTEYIDANPTDDAALTLRAQQNWALDRRGAAITDHLAAIRLNPESPSRFDIKACYEILNFFNKDLYNP